MNAISKPARPHKNHPNPSCRLYLPLWEEIKREREVITSVRPQDWRRVKKAVTKEKDRDVAVKQLAYAEGEKFVLHTSYDLQLQELTFKLEGRIGIVEVDISSKHVAEKLV